MDLDTRLSNQPLLEAVHSLVEDFKQAEDSRAIAQLSHRWLELCRKQKWTLAETLEHLMPMVRENPVLEQFTVALIREWETSQEKGWKLLEENTRSLQSANDHLVQANSSRSEFISLVSHEIRTPLTVIAGACELLSDELVGESHQSCLSLIQYSVEHIRRLIEDILVFSKLEAGMLEIQIEPVSFGAIAKASRELTYPLFQEKQLSLEFEGPEAMVLADPMRLRQVLINLLSNAVKYSPSGTEIRVSTRIQSPMLEVAVMDRGMGIPLEDQTQIFERFRQVKGRRNYGGTGLGLPICRYLVELHGGTITVDSTPGEGSTFRFTLPLADLADASLDGLQ